MVSNRLFGSVGAAREADAKILQRAATNVELYAARPDLIDQRLGELDREWYIERVLQAGSAGLSLLGVVMGSARGRRWFLLPLIVQGFYMQHAVQGTCATFQLLRRMGMRTRDEIARERYALKALRGDFKAVMENPDEAGRRAFDATSDTSAEYPDDET